MYIFLTAGHPMYGGAKGILDETVVDREVSTELASILRNMGHKVKYYNSEDIKDYVVETSMANQENFDWYIDIHCNASNGLGHGTETLVYTDNKPQAHKISANISKLGFYNRGVKVRTGLYILKHTNAKALLVECFFIDNKTDCDLYNKVGPHAIAKAIAEGLTGQSLKAEWKKDSKGWWYQLEGGTYPKDKWLQIDKEWYYFGTDGYAYHDRWIEYKGDRYYLGSDCKMLTSGVIDGWTIGSDGKAYKEEIKVESSKHLIISAPTATKEQMLAWIKTKNEKCVGPASLLWDISLLYGINPVVSVAQFCWETDFIYVKGISNAGLDESYHNPCGLKITSGGSDTDSSAHMKFPTWAHGFSAYLDHLALYAGVEGYPSDITLDPRHFQYLKGTATYVEDLAGKWCPSEGYSNNIIGYINQIENTEVN